jgi:hypothetical protein
MKIGTLNSVVYTRTERGFNGVRKTLSDIQICMGKLIVARRTIPGRWPEAEAIKEFKRFPERFTPQGDFNSDNLKSFAA